MSLSPHLHADDEYAEAEYDAQEAVSSMVFNTFICMQASERSFVLLVWVGFAQTSLQRAFQMEKDGV